MKLWFSSLRFRKKCPHVQQTMPISQYDKHTLHCVLGSVSINSHSSKFPTSWIISFDSWLKGLNDWLCCRSRWRACRFGWFSIFWIDSRTLALFNCFTVKCCCPGILKSMSSSIHSRINSLSVLSVSASLYPSGSSFTATVSLPSCPDLSWVCSTLRLLLSSDEHACTLITSCVIPSCHDLSEEQSSSWKDFTLISWERDVSTLTNTPCGLWSCPDLSQIGFGIGWKNFACRPPSSCGRRATSYGRRSFEPNKPPPFLSFVQSWQSEIFSGGRVTCMLFQIRLLQSSV